MTISAKAYAAARAADFNTIPQIDLAPLRDGSERGLRQVARELYRASIDVGVFQVSNHGVPKYVIDSAFAHAKQFFALPLADKQAVAAKLDQRGFVAHGTGLGSTAIPSERFLFGPDPAQSDAAAVSTLLGSKGWPPAMPSLRPAMETTFHALLDCGNRLMRAFAIALELPPTFFAERFGRPLSHGALDYSPPALSGGALVAPSGEGCITLFAQDANGGLQVQNRAGAWVNAPPLEESLVISVGKLLQRWTNGVFVSTPYRLMRDAKSEHYSIAVVHAPHADTRIETIPSCVPEGQAPRFASIGCREYLSREVSAGARNG